MNSFFFMSDSSCPVPRPAPELLEIVVKQKEGNQNWRAKYIVATKVTRQDKFRQRPHHAVHSCARVWLGEIHTLTAPDGSARWPDSDGEDDAPTPPPQQSAGGKGGKGKAATSTLKPPSVSPTIAGAAAAAVAAASAAAASDTTTSTSNPSNPTSATATASSSQNGGSSSAPSSPPVPPLESALSAGIPALPSMSATPAALPSLPTVGQATPGLPVPGLPTALTPQQQQQALQQMMMQPMGMTMPMSYPASIAQFMPLLSGVLTPAPASKDAFSMGWAKPKPAGPFRLPTLPDLLICLRPIEEWGLQRAPVLFVQTHGGQEYLLLKHHATYIIDVAPEHEVVSVRISMKNEKPKTLRIWKYDTSVQRPAVGQGQMDLEDISRSIPPGMVVPLIHPPGNGDSPFHLLHIDKELHPTLPTVVLHQLHEPQHLHTEQTFFITPLAKGQRRIKKVLLPPPPSKPSSNKQQQIHAAAAGVISAIATGGNVSEASATLAATKLKKRSGKKGKGEDLMFLGPNAAMLNAAMVGQSHDDGSSSESEAAGLDGLGRKRKRKAIPPPSVAARLKATNPALLGHHVGTIDYSNIEPTSMTLPQNMLQEYFNSFAYGKKEENEEEEITDDEDEDHPMLGELKHDEPKMKRRRRKARLQSDIGIGPSPSLQAFFNVHNGKFLTKTARYLWNEVKRQPEYHPQAYTKEQADRALAQRAEDAKDPKAAVAAAAAAASGDENKEIGLVQPGQQPAWTQIHIDYGKLAKEIGEGVSAGDLQSLWKYVSDHMLARKVIDLDDLDLRSLWGKPLDPELIAARVRAGKPVPGPTAPTFPFPFPMFPMFPGAGGLKYPPLPAVAAPVKPFDQDHHPMSAMSKAEQQMSAFTKALGGPAGAAAAVSSLSANPIFASMFMPLMSGAAAAAGSAAVAANSAAVAAAAANANANNSSQANSSAHDNWMKYIAPDATSNTQQQQQQQSMPTSQSLFPFLAHSFNHQQQQQHQQQSKDE